ncbi:MAG: CPBP family intramembrane glutamic endopeptidase [Polyangiales bacterium]
MSETKETWHQRLRTELRKPELALPLVLTLGFVLWGHEGRPWALTFLEPMTPALTGMVSFVIGALVMVAIPALVLKLLGENLTDYGLGWGERKHGLIFAIVASVLSIPVMYFVSADPNMQAEYPLYAPGDSLVAYEATYFFFFAAGEISVRGFLLFGVKRWSGSTSLALGVSTIVQTVWHLDKPLAEMVAAPVWGIAIGALCLRLRSVWYALVFHYVSNVALDLWVLSR